MSHSRSLRKDPYCCISHKQRSQQREIPFTTLSPDFSERPALYHTFHQIDLCHLLIELSSYNHPIFFYYYRFSFVRIRGRKFFGLLQPATGHTIFFWAMCTSHQIFSYSSWQPF
jgi:hypothetical protein